MSFFSLYVTLHISSISSVRDISCPEALDWLKQQPMLKGRGLRATLLPHLKHAASTASNFSSLSHSLSPPTFLGRPSPSSGLYGSSLHAAVCDVWVLFCLLFSISSLFVYPATS